jgi:RNA polymerase sigma-70 factor, ECF subfamily
MQDATAAQPRPALIDLGCSWTLPGMTLPAASSATDADGSAGRRATLEALFLAHGRAVYAFARRRASAADADEVVAETFLVAWRRLDDVPADALPWLLGVARRSLANIVRGETRQSALRLRLASTATAAAPDVGEQDRSLSDAVRRSLDGLNPAERDALTLLAWDGLTAAEAATVLGCSRAAIYLRLHRARRRLADDLRAHADAEERP